MIDVEAIVRDALAGVPASLRDDPSAWSDAPDLEDVKDAVSQTAYDNVASAVAKAFGAASERIATLMDAAVAEDGPLADLDAVWDAEITGTPIRPDLTELFSAEDWQGRVDALLGAMRHVAKRVADTARGTVPDSLVQSTIALDPRLAHLAVDDSFTPPAFLGLDPADQPAADIIWDDEPAAEADPWADEIVDPQPAAAPVETGRRGRGKRNGASVPKLCALLELAGFADKDVAAALGFDKSYYSLMRSGKRPWAGVRDEAVAKLLLELNGRRDALAQAVAALDTDEVRHPAAVA
jgi:hypothetical protein